VYVFYIKRHTLSIKSAIISHIIKGLNMTNVIFISDIKQENGKTWKENNLAIQHEIPIGSLVEITYDSEYDEPDEKVFGLRLFVVNHSRDCDGTPLYDLSFDKKAYQQWKEADEKIRTKNFKDSMDESLCRMLYWQTGGMILRHYSLDSLKLIK
jgi:hypothetical protein